MTIERKESAFNNLFEQLVSKSNSNIEDIEGRIEALKYVESKQINKKLIDICIGDLTNARNNLEGISKILKK